ncbi:hypothetical protein [Actinacidiphila rubida]|uniref:hypothetical protein n=1 Tax=Actinacidiphila rubida TaxID=310780 RepID=UPI001FEAF034|nr:hypothetical protein [Actinacidiphila rubida]
MTDSTPEPHSPESRSPEPPSPDAAAHGAAHAHFDALNARLDRIEARLTPAHGDLAAAEHRVEPAWRRVTQGEERWASAAAILAVVAIQLLVLPARLVVQPRWLMPAVESALLVALVAGNPRRIERGSRLLRSLGLALIVVIGGSNGYSAVRLVDGLVRGTEGSAAGPLLLRGGAIWLINVVIFALAYWELDRGGPAARAAGERDVPDFLFVQMQSPDLAPPHWEPVFFDYLYLSFTNSTAFSPTDVMPSSLWAKALMMGQSAVSLLTVVLVVARAVNILG